MEVFKLFATMSMKDLISNPLMKVQKVMKDAKVNAQSLSGKIMGLGKAMLPVIAVAAAIVTHFGYATKQAADFESAVARLAIVNREGAESLKQLEYAALKMASTSIYSANEVVAAQSVLAQSGFTATDNIRMLAYTEQYAAAAGLELAAATQNVADILGVYGLQAYDTQRVIDTITAATRTADVSFVELTETLKKTGVMFSNSNVPLNEAVALMGALGNAGIKGGDAVSVLEPIFMKLSAPTQSAADALRSLGLSGKDAAGNLKSPIAILSELSGALDKMNDGDKLATLKQLVGEKPAYTLFELIQRDGLSSLNALKDSLSDVNGVTAKMAAIQNGTLASAMKRMNNSINTINITIGKVFAPVVNMIANKLGGLASILSELAASPIGQMLIKLTAGMALGVLAVGGIATAIAAVTAVLPAFLGGLTALGTAVAAIAWPFTVVAIAVAAFAFIWRKNIGGIADFVKDKFNKINLVIKGVTAVFRSLKDGVGEIRGALAEDIQANGLVGAVTLIGKVFYRVYQVVSGFFSAIGEGLSIAMTSLAPVGSLIKAIFAPVGQLFGLLGKVIGLLVGASAATDSSGWKTFGKIIGTAVVIPFRILAFVIGLVAKVLTVIVKVATLPFRLLIGAISKAIDVFVTFSGMIKKVFSGAGEQATGFGKVIGIMAKVIMLPFKLIGAAVSGIFNLFRGVGSLISKVFSSAGEKAAGFGKVIGVVGKVILLPFRVLQGIFGLYAKVFKGIGGVAGKIFGGIGKAASGLKNAVGNAFSNMGSLAKKGLSAIGSGIAGAFKGMFNIANKIAGFFGIDLSESGKKLIETFTAGIKSVITAPFDAVKGGLTKLRNLLPFSDAKEGPLSTLTLSGTRMMSTIGAGITKGASVLYDATSGAFDMLPVPEIKPAFKEAEIETSQAYGSTGRRADKSSAAGTHIIIQNITLPGVKNADDFVAALEQIALQGGKSD